MKELLRMIRQNGILNHAKQYNKCRVWFPGGTQYKRPLRGCAANMGSIINLLVYQWPRILCKIWYMNGSIFQKLDSNLRKFEKKSDNFGQNFAPNQADWYVNWSLFLGKLVYVWVQFHIPSGTSLPKPKLSYPLPGVGFDFIFRLMAHISTTCRPLASSQWWMIIKWCWAIRKKSCQWELC